MQRSKFNDFMQPLYEEQNRAALAIYGDNEGFFLTDGKLQGWVLDMLIQHWHIDYIANDIAREFVQEVFNNLDKFGSFNFILIILKVLFGANSINIINRYHGSIGLEIVNPDESRVKLYVDDSGNYYLHPSSANYAALGSENAISLVDWAIGFCNQFLYSGTTVQGVIVTIS